MELSHILLARNAISEHTVELDVQGEVFGEVLNHFEGVVTDGDAGGCLCHLANDVGLLRLMVRPNSVQAPVKLLKRCCKASSIWTVREASPANKNSLMKKGFTP